MFTLESGTGVVSTLDETVFPNNNQLFWSGKMCAWINWTIFLLAPNRGFCLCLLGLCVCFTYKFIYIYVIVDIVTDIDSFPPCDIEGSNLRQPSSISFTYRRLTSTIRNPVMFMAPYSITSVSHLSSMIWVQLLKWVDREKAYDER